MEIKIDKESARKMIETCDAILGASEGAERSGAAQPCLPSATGSADAGAADEAGADSSERSADKAVQAARFRITGSFIGGCDWESRETWPTRKAAEKVMRQWKHEEICKSKNYQIAEVPPDAHSAA